MMHVMEYRRHAEQCRTMAKSARNGLRRAQFLQLARQWDNIADEREKLLELEKKVAQPLTPDTGRAMTEPAPASAPMRPDLAYRTGGE